MIKTTYICDKCKNEQDTHSQFWTLGIWARHDGEKYESNSDMQRASINGRSIQVCRPCLESLGVHVQAETKKQPAYVERTTEDILRELIERVTP